MEENCAECKRTPPDGCLQQMAMGGGGELVYTPAICPPCGLYIQNRDMGINRTSFVEGSHAQDMLEETLQHYQETNQEYNYDR